MSASVPATASVLCHGLLKSCYLVYNEKHISKMHTYVVKLSLTGKYPGDAHLGIHRSYSNGQR